MSNIANKFKDISEQLLSENRNLQREVEKLNKREVNVKQALEAERKSFIEWISLDSFITVNKILAALRDRTNKEVGAGKEIDTGKCSRPFVFANTALNEISEETGWNETSMLELACRYIDNQCDNQSFIDFLKQAAKDEMEDV